MLWRKGAAHTAAQTSVCVPPKQPRSRSSCCYKVLLSDAADGLVRDVKIAGDFAVTVTGVETMDNSAALTLSQLEAAAKLLALALGPFVDGPVRGSAPARTRQGRLKSSITVVHAPKCCPPMSRAVT